MPKKTKNKKSAGGPKAESNPAKLDTASTDDRPVSSTTADSHDSIAEAIASASSDRDSDSESDEDMLWRLVQPRQRIPTARKKSNVSQSGAKNLDSGGPAQHSKSVSQTKLRQRKRTKSAQAKQKEERLALALESMKAFDASVEVDSELSMVEDEVEKRPEEQNFTEKEALRLRRNGISQFNAGEFNQAATYFKDAAEVARHLASSTEKIGVGTASSAEEVGGFAPARDMWLAEVLLRLGLSYAKAGETRESIDTFDSLACMFGDTSDRDRRLLRITALEQQAQGLREIGEMERALVSRRQATNELQILTGSAKVSLMMTAMGSALTKADFRDMYRLLRHAGVAIADHLITTEPPLSNIAAKTASGNVSEEQERKGNDALSRKKSYRETIQRLLQLAGGQQTDMWSSTSESTDNVESAESSLRLPSSRLFSPTVADLVQFAAPSLGLTFLMVAAAHDNEVATRMLLGAGSDPNRLDQAGHSALGWAAKRGNYKCMRYILGGGGQLGRAELASIATWPQESFKELVATLNRRKSNKLESIASGGKEGNDKTAPPPTNISGLEGWKESKRKGRERELQKWEDTGGVAFTSIEFTEGSSETSWDQFEANKRLFGVQANFVEGLYTTPLDKKRLTKEQTEMAERIAAEIASTKSCNVHIAEERGQVSQDDGADEESKYSAVLT